MRLDVKDAHFCPAGLCSSAFLKFFFLIIIFGALSSQRLGLLTCTPGARLGFARLHSRGRLLQARGESRRQVGAAASAARSPEMTAARRWDVGAAPDAVSPYFIPV